MSKSKVLFSVIVLVVIGYSTSLAWQDNTKGSCELDEASEKVCIAAQNYVNVIADSTLTAQEKKAKIQEAMIKVNAGNANYQCKNPIIIPQIP